MLRHVYDMERARIARLSMDDDSGEYAYPVFGCGSVDSQVIFVGEAPGAEEARQATPFVGKAGRQFDELLAHAGLRRDDVFITNAVKFRPVKRNQGRCSNRTPTRSEVKLGGVCLKAEIDAIRPRIVATLGNTPLAAVCDLANMCPMKVGDAHGRAFEIVIGALRLELFPLYHPASVIYNRSLADVLKCDIIALGARLRQCSETEETT
ncbi:MAG: uracil-DNA glycosylase [Clostridia bacterium]|nr:uracil-DNA glycosylase [Clostridia bacterium]